MGAIVPASLLLLEVITIGTLKKLMRWADEYKKEHEPMVGMAFIDKVRDGWEVAVYYMEDMNARAKYIYSHHKTLEAAQEYVDDMGRKYRHMFNFDDIPTIIDDIGEG